MRVLLIAGFGALLGLLAKWVDGTPIGIIGSELGFWIFVTTLVAVYSPSRMTAGLHAFAFLAGMVVTYYAYSTAIFGFLPRGQFFGWGAITLLAPIGGYTVWHGRGDGWSAALCAALPISVLVAEGYPFVYTYSAPRAFDLAAAALLFILVPRGGAQKLRVLTLMLGLALAIDRFRLLALLPWST